MRFLHTADWQMGMKAEHVGEVGDKVRRARLEAAERVMAAARREEVDFVVVAGDLFEDNAVEGILVQQVVDILDGAGRPVYVIPGNHDPLVPGSVWEHPAWSGAGDLHVLRRAEPVEAAEGLLFPCPLTGKFSPGDPTAWIDATGEERVCVGVAHGTVEGIPADTVDFPIPRDAAERRGLDYLAVGHWHSTSLFPTADGACRMAYSGTHEPTRFGERDSGNVLVVEIPARGEPPEVSRVPTGVLGWEKIERTVQAPEDLEALVGEIETRDGADKTLLWVVLRGLLPPGAGHWLQRIEELLQARFLHGRLDDTGLLPSPGDEAWIDALPAGYLREAAARLRDRALAGDGGGGEAEIARLALLELFAIARGEGAR